MPDADAQKTSAMSTPLAAATDFVPKIQKLLESKKDESGNAVVNVLAAGNEYVIYEKECKDINDRLRVLISGKTEASELDLLIRFTKVKSRYVEAKGLLYRSPNFGMMKNRIAHVLSSVFTDKDFDGIAEFDKLIKQIKFESDQMVVRRVVYALPAVIAAVVSIITAFILYDGAVPSRLNMALLVIVSGSIGCSMSVLSRVGTMNLEEVESRWWYLVVGFERVFLSYMAAACALILLKAEIINISLGQQSPWGVMAVLITASFSEALVPSVLKKIEGKF